MSFCTDGTRSPHPLKRTTLQCILSHKAVLWLLGFTIVWGTDQDGLAGPLVAGVVHLEKLISLDALLGQREGAEPRQMTFC